MNYSAEVLGKMILTERKRCGLTQDMLGKKINVVGKQISDYENGRIVPPLPNLFKLCEVFDCELGYLLGEETYAEGTQRLTYVTEYLGLSSKSISNIRKITGKGSTNNVIRRLSPNNTKILNQIIESDTFEQLISDLRCLEERYNDLNQKRESLQSISNELNRKAPEVINIALKYIDTHDTCIESINEEIIEAMQNIDSIIDQEHSRDSLKEEIRFTRFKIQETITELMDEIFLGNNETK